VYEQRPVRLGRAGSGVPSGLWVALTALALVTVIVKPWTFGGPGGASPPASEPATAAPSVAPPPADLGFESRAYDPKIFGVHEPAPAWGLWPAGFLVTFGFVIDVPNLPTSSEAPSPGPRATHRPTAAPVASDAGPSWPAAFDVPDGNHLLMMGINMPLGYSVQEAHLYRLDEGIGGLIDPVPLESLPSPWPAHFAVLALAADGPTGRLIVWPAGRYQLAVTFAPGGLMRSVLITVAPSR
jgi:hypothetical protein